MKIMLWAFGGVAALAIGIIIIAAWAVFRRDAEEPNARYRRKRRPGKPPRHGPRRGVPKSR
ncbi:hypothetical protein [Gymnodinialimonas ceratoperidinii]|uniref:Uncharacterized protein n=1 Tax=Gymnodinialimonas ceratoperidinii TaxID=2856823 RepID=A0A8F6YA54_9RHOB|nr:hypothetical protein [Gymnodinialimonas ceratoperidinii]QXT38616.1 hypothetical protein KYE46_11800 [Gymnodinialimonas ceratoperidinii]